MDDHLPQGYHVSDNEEVIVVPARVLAMLTWPGYMAMFWHFVSERDYYHRQAWESCEKTLADFRLPARYSSYESFKDAKSKSDRRDGGGLKVMLW